MAIMSCMQVHPKGEMSVDEFKAWLRQFDADHNGRISQDELKDALHSLSLWSAYWKTRQAFKAVDSNHNGQIDPKEIENLVNFARQRLHMKIYEYDW